MARKYSKRESQQNVKNREMLILDAKKRQLQLEVEMLRIEIDLESLEVEVESSDESSVLEPRRGVKSKVVVPPQKQDGGDSHVPPARPADWQFANETRMNTPRGRDGRPWGTIHPRTDRTPSDRDVIASPAEMRRHGISSRGERGRTGVRYRSRSSSSSEDEDRSMQEKYSHRSKLRRNRTRHSPARYSRRENRRDDSSSRSRSRYRRKKDGERLERVTIPVFTGDKSKFESWLTAFSVVDESEETGKYKMLRLVKYVDKDISKVIEDFGYTKQGYRAAME